MSKTFEKNQKDNNNSNNQENSEIEYGPEYNNMSQEEKQRLGRLMYEAKSSKGWIPTLKDGETRRFRFIYDERTRYGLKKYHDNDPDEEGVMKQFFYVLDLDDPEQVQFGEPKEFLMSRLHSVDILKYLRLGFRDMQLTRHGSDMRTWYEVKTIKMAAVTTAN